MKKTWQDQLNEIIVDNLFGHKIEWNIEDVKSYIFKLEEFGAEDIQIIDLDSLRFQLPALSKDRANLLLFILTNGSMPSSVDYCKGTKTMRLNWDL